MTERKYLPTYAELVDRLSIISIKELKIPGHKEEYAQEIADIVHDIGLILGNVRTAEAIRDIIILAQINLHIFQNESEVRNGTGKGDLHLTHSLNGVRNTAKNRLASAIGERKDYKVDCLAADHKQYLPSGW